MLSAIASLAELVAVVFAICGMPDEDGDDWGRAQWVPVLQLLELAERVGFEPTIPVKVCPLSRRIVSTTHAPLRVGQIEL